MRGWPRRCRRSPAPKRCATRSRRRTPYPAAAALLADLRIDRGVAAPHHAAGADRAAPGAADPRGAGVRLPPRHGRPAPELGQARGGRRRAAGGGADRGRLLRARRGGAPRAAAEAARRRAAAARRARATAYSEATRGELAIFETAAEMLRALRPRRAAPLHHLAHRERERPARGAAAAEGSGPGARHARRRRRHRPDRRRRCSRPSATCAAPRRSCASTTRCPASPR